MFDNLDNPAEHDGATLLVDGDIVAYQAAASADGRVYIVQQKEGHEYGRFKYKKEAVEFVEGNLDIALEIELVYEPEPISHALHNIKLNMEQIQALSPSGEMKVYLTGNDNYRKQIDPEYKAHRKTQRVPEHLNECKQYLLNKYSAELEEGLEADDLLGVEQMLYRKKGEKSIICTLDKDLKCIPGLHYDWRKDVLSDINPVEADLFFYEQCLMGDSTDNIPGLKGIGPKKAEAWMSDALKDDVLYDEGSRNVALYEHALHLYCQKTERLEDELVEDWLERIEELFRKTATLVWIQRKKYSIWTPPEESDG